MLTALACVLWVQVVRVAGVEVCLQPMALRWTQPRISKSHLLLLGTLIEHNELVLLPVACFGVLWALLGLCCGTLREASVFATAGLRRRVGLTVWLERALWAAYEAFTARRGDPHGVVLMDEIFLCLRSMLFGRIFLVLKGEQGKCTFPWTQTKGVVQALMAVLPQIVVSACFSGCIGAGVDNTGGASAHCPAVLDPHTVGAVMWGTVLVMQPTPCEVGKSIFGISELAERERKPRHGELAVEMVVAGGADPVKYVWAVWSAIPERSHAAMQTLNNIMGPISMDILR